MGMLRGTENRARQSEYLLPCQTRLRESGNKKRHASRVHYEVEDGSYSMLAG